MSLARLPSAGWPPPRKVGVVLGLALTALPGPVQAEERCGWLENPTPGNFWLKDPHGLWTISAQGG
jgi:hypothetical protein